MSGPLHGEKLNGRIVKQLREWAAVPENIQILREPAPVDKLVDFSECELAKRYPRRGHRVLVR